MTDISEDVELGAIKLTARTASQARTWIKQHYPQGANYRGYNKEGECILLSTVRERGNKAPVASAHRNRSGKAVQFTCTPL